VTETKIWTIVELLRWTADYLATKGFHNARLNAELLLSGVLGIKRLDLYLQFDRPLQPHELAEFKSRLRRRVHREPLQYIEGEAAFRDLRLQVDPRVLIPRPETERLVGEVLVRIRGRGPLTGLDVGTGSGAIALSLVTEGPFSRVVATDISAAALEVARANHAAVAPSAPVEFREGSGYAPVGEERFDVIVSNPPYIAASERDTLDTEVRDWEPAGALFAGSTGLEVIRDLILDAPNHLLPGGLLALEIGDRQADSVTDLIRRAGRFEEPQVRQDLAGRDRIIIAALAGRW
jgi:release factor glutamine methyltransferase